MFKRILIYLYVNFMGAIKIAKEQIFDRQRELNEKDLPDQTGRHIVITGGNRGIGLEAVKKFLAAGAHVIIGCRRPSNLEAALLKCRTAGLTGGSYKCVELDLMSMKSVRKFAEVIISKNIPIHVLVNNAGIMFGPRKETINGFESQMATNYLGHFLLTSLLFPQLRRAGRPDNFSRIVNVSSVAHFSGSWMNFDALLSIFVLVRYATSLSPRSRADGKRAATASMIREGAVAEDAVATASTPGMVAHGRRFCSASSARGSRST